MTEVEYRLRTLNECLCALKGAVATIEYLGTAGRVSGDQWNQVKHALYEHLPDAEITTDACLRRQPNRAHRKNEVGRGEAYRPRSSTRGPDHDRPQGDDQC